MAPKKAEPRPAKKPKSSDLKPLSTQPQFSISSFLPKLTVSAPSPPSTKKATPRSTPGAKDVKGKAKVVELEAAEESVDQGLWVDRFGPADRDELGVHPKKVTDVFNWLQEAYNPKLEKYRRLLVLSGPSGAAKTTTLRVLADELDVEILEYRNGSNLTFAVDDSRESMIHQFTNFLSRAGMAPALALGPDPDLPPTASPSFSSTSFAPLPSTRFKRLILLEDLPNTSHYPTKLALQSALMQYLASPRVTCPLVVIVSEALSRPGVGMDAESTGGGGGGREDSVDSRSVCGVEVLHSPGCREISFNPIAVTIMKKALSKVLDRIYSSSSSSPFPASSRPSDKTLELIIAHSNGDIRSALMSLQFLSSNPELAGVTSLAAGEVKKGRKRKSDGSEVKGASEVQVKKLLQFVTSRESSLFIFHALGKVLYSKRWGQNEADDKKDLNRPGIAPNKPYNKLPKHLRDEWTRLPSKVNPDVLFAEAPIDSDIFLSYIHHNYTPFTNEIEECSSIIEGMSCADSLMRMEGDDWLRRAPLTSQYSFNVSVRSTLLCLPSPVPHRKHVMRKADLWEKLREQRANEEGIEEMGRRREGWAVVPPFEGGGGGGQRGRRSLGTEVVAYAGAIERGRRAGRGTKSFVEELATFPPVLGKGAQGITGEPLGEKEVEDYEMEEQEEEKGGSSDAEMEVEEEERDEAEKLYDPEDDIVDSD